MKFENWPGDFRGEVIQRCGRKTDDDGQMDDDDGRQVVTTAYPELI